MENIMFYYFVNFIRLHKIRPFYIAKILLFKLKELSALFPNQLMGIRVGCLST